MLFNVKTIHRNLSNYRERQIPKNDIILITPIANIWLCSASLKKLSTKTNANHTNKLDLENAFNTTVKQFLCEVATLLLNSDSSYLLHSARLMKLSNDVSFYLFRIIYTNEISLKSIIIGSAWFNEIMNQFIETFLHLFANKKSTSYANYQLKTNGPLSWRGMSD